MPREEATPEQLADEEQRSTPIGYFNFAETYRPAARTQRRSKAKSTHKDSPTRFLYYHAVELYLKTYLRAHGIHPYDLRTKYGHKVGKLARKAKTLGFTFDDEDWEVIELMDMDDTIIRSRYLMTGPFRWPDISALDRTCKSFRKTVAAELRSRGIKLRMGR